MSQWYVYIDDRRIMDEKFRKHLREQNIIPINIHDYDCAIAFLEDMKNNEIFIDLKDNEDGYYICRYIVERQIPLIGFHIHSMDSISAQNMRNILHDYKEFI